MFTFHKQLLFYVENQDEITVPWYHIFIDNTKYSHALILHDFVPT